MSGRVADLRYEVGVFNGGGVDAIPGLGKGGALRLVYRPAKPLWLGLSGSMRHRAELSYREIAEALEIPEKTVKSRLFSARRLLAEALGDLRTRRAAGGRRP